ncbi:MAG: hypothetical protein KIS92_17830 [Planctomycetota bacterium]|nr:hypothetical protein [Planctomycetota bacterium]
MRLTDPVRSTKLPGTVARVTALVMMILAGVLLLIGLYLYLRLGPAFEKQAIRSVILSLALAGLALAIDRDRGKAAKTEGVRPPTPGTETEAPKRHDRIES